MWELWISLTAAKNQCFIIVTKVIEMKLRNLGYQLKLFAHEISANSYFSILLMAKWVKARIESQTYNTKHGRSYCWGLNPLFASLPLRLPANKKGNPRLLCVDMILMLDYFAKLQTSTITVNSCHTIPLTWERIKKASSCQTRIWFQYQWRSSDVFDMDSDICRWKAV